MVKELKNKNFCTFILSEVMSRYIECGDYDHMLESTLKEADLIIESVCEDLETKQKMYRMVEKYRKSEKLG